MRDAVNIAKNGRLWEERPTLIMELLEMVDFVLVLVVAMMSGSSLPFGTWISIAFIVIVVIAEEHPTGEHLTDPSKPYGRSQCESN